MSISLLAEKIKYSEMFSGLTDWELDQLAKDAHIVSAEKGQSLISENTSTHEVFLVTMGRVEVVITIPGTETNEVIATLGAGEMFGELVLLGRTRRSASAVAKEKVELIQWNKDDLLKLFKVNHHIGYEVMTQVARVLADRLYSTNMGLRTALAHKHRP